MLNETFSLNNNKFKTKYDPYLTSTLPALEKGRLQHTFCQNIIHILLNDYVCLSSSLTVTFGREGPKFGMVTIGS